MDYSLIKNQRSWTNSESGIAAFAAIAPLAFFETNGIKSPVAPFNNAGDGITIKDPHVFKDGKGFIFFALAPQKNSLTAPISGDLGFYKQNQEATIFIPGSNPAIHETYQSLVNVPLIVLVKDSRFCGDNQYMQLGTQCEPAFLGGSFDTGTTKDGVKGFNVKVNYDGPIMYYVVEGGPVYLADES